WTCRNVTLSRYGPITFSNSSRTGPQYCDWHRAGVANSSATGLPAPITSAADAVWRGHIGSRVQIGETSSVAVVAGDGALSAAWPIGTVAGPSLTWIANWVRPPCTRASAFQTPALSNTGVERYTPRFVGSPAGS